MNVRLSGRGSPVPSPGADLRWAWGPSTIFEGRGRGIQREPRIGASHDVPRRSPLGMGSFALIQDRMQARGRRLALAPADDGTGGSALIAGIGAMISSAAPRSPRALIFAFARTEPMLRLAWVLRSPLIGAAMSRARPRVRPGRTRGIRPSPLHASPSAFIGVHLRFRHLPAPLDMGLIVAFRIRGLRPPGGDAGRGRAGRWCGRARARRHRG